MDQVAALQHDTQAREDYGLCRATGIRAVREGARWPIVDRGGVLDLGGIRHLARLGREAGLIQIWDLMHYGYPDDLDPFSNEFVERFATFARAVATVVREETPGSLYFTPVNEISYNAWTVGDFGTMAPFAHGRASEYKRVLVRAAIAGTNAIWEVDPAATMLTVEPFLRLHAPPDRPDLQAEAEYFNQHVVMEAFDLLAGRLEPELGGSRAHLGIIGVNYYSGNQLTMPLPEQPQRSLSWDDPDWLPLRALLLELQERYGGPLVIAETSASGEARPGWIAFLAHEAQGALNCGVDLQGICLYPFVTSHDWEDPTAFFDGGLYDLFPQPDGRLKRVLSVPAAAALREAQALLDPENLPVEPLEATPPPLPDPPVQVARPLESARFKPQFFSYQTLIAGDSLVIELYCFEPGGSLTAHRHETTEHVLTVISGEATVRIGEGWITLRQGESVLAPAGLYHGIYNGSAERLIVQQVSAPKPWDARFAGPHPSHVQRPVVWGR
jgi:quercetin dioxygenase-like cupin family protein